MLTGFEDKMNDEERYARLAEKVNKEQVIEMNAMERLKDSMVRVRSLVDFYQEYPDATLDMMDSMTAVTIRDLETLLNGLADRDISLKRPELKTQREMERDVKLARIIVDQKDRATWIKGYDQGYKAGRDGEATRVRELVDKYLAR